MSDRKDESAVLPKDQIKIFMPGLAKEQLLLPSRVNIGMLVLVSHGLGAMCIKHFNGLSSLFRVFVGYPDL